MSCTSTALRYLDTVRVMPRLHWITTEEIHARLKAIGYTISRRSVERDLHKLAVPFGIEFKLRAGHLRGGYHWRRRRSRSAARARRTCSPPRCIRSPRRLSMPCARSRAALVYGSV